MSHWKAVVLGLLLIYPLKMVYAVKTLLINYEQLVRAVENGDNVRAIIHFDNCDITEQSVPSQAVQNEIMRNLDGATTRFNFTRYLHFKERINNQLRDTVVTSMTNFVEQPTAVLKTLFARLNVYEDNTAIVLVNYYDSILHKSLLRVEWLCDISNGHDNNGLLLFDAP